MIPLNILISQVIEMLSPEIEKLQQNIICSTNCPCHKSTSHDSSSNQGLYQLTTPPVCTNPIFVSVISYKPVIGWIYDRIWTIDLTSGMIIFVDVIRIFA